MSKGAGYETHTLDRAADPYTLIGTVSHPEVGAAAMTGGEFTLVGGFWGSAASPYKVLVIR